MFAAQASSTWGSRVSKDTTLLAVRSRAKFLCDFRFRNGDARAAEMQRIACVLLDMLQRNRLLVDRTESWSELRIIQQGCAPIPNSPIGQSSQPCRAQLSDPFLRFRKASCFNTMKCTNVLHKTHLHGLQLHHSRWLLSDIVGSIPVAKKSGNLPSRTMEVGEGQTSACLSPATSFSHQPRSFIVHNHPDSLIHQKRSIHSCDSSGKCAKMLNMIDNY